MTANITDIINQKLKDAIDPEFIDIIDLSAAHAGHAGNRGGGHYSLTLVSGRFEGKTAVERHRMVYQALNDLMKEDIHALAINALTPTENSQ